MVRVIYVRLRVVGGSAPHFGVASDWGKKIALWLLSTRAASASHYGGAPSPAVVSQWMSVWLARST